MPKQLANGYRDYDEHDVRLTQEIRVLGGLGIPVERTRPFLDCLTNGHRHADDCPASPAGIRVPPLELQDTGGAAISIDTLGAGRTVIYIYPLTGRPGTDLPDGWDSIPGARGCTPEACGFRDHYQELPAAGAVGVFGLSSQDTGYQREVVERLHLPFQMLSDPARSLAQALDLPTFEISGLTLCKRLTLIIRDGVIEHVFYPIFPPSEHAGQVLTWLRSNPL